MRLKFLFTHDLTSTEMEDQFPLDLSKKSNVSEEPPSNVDQPLDLSRKSESMPPLNDTTDDDVIVVGVQRPRKPKHSTGTVDNSATGRSAAASGMSSNISGLHSAYQLGREAASARVGDVSGVMPQVDGHRLTLPQQLLKHLPENVNAAFSPYDIGTGLMKLKQALMMAKNPQEEKKLAHNFQRLALQTLLKARMHQQQSRHAPRDPSAKRSTATATVTSDQAGPSHSVDGALGSAGMAVGEAMSRQQVHLQQQAHLAAVSNTSTGAPARMRDSIPTPSRSVGRDITSSAILAGPAVPRTMLDNSLSTTATERNLGISSPSGSSKKAIQDGGVPGVAGASSSQAGSSMIQVRSSLAHSVHTGQTEPNVGVAVRALIYKSMHICRWKCMSILLLASRTEIFVRQNLAKNTTVK